MSQSGKLQSVTLQVFNSCSSTQVVKQTNKCKLTHKYKLTGRPKYTSCEKDKLTWRPKPANYKRCLTTPSKSVSVICNQKLYRVFFYMVRTPPKNSKYKKVILG